MADEEDEVIDTATSVTIGLCPDALKEVIKAAEACGSELAAMIDEQYPSRDDQPVQARRHRRDMTVVDDLRAALALLPNPFPFGSKRYDGRAR